MTLSKQQQSGQLRQRCSVKGCEETATEFFGDIDQKEGYCHKHASQIEAMAEYAEENQ